MLEFIKNALVGIWEFIKKLWVRVVNWFKNIYSWFKNPFRVRKLQEDRNKLAVSIKRTFPPQNQHQPCS
jgi:hypothetical protein